ncbi:hypothetical protein Moror_12753 [Moniliophthora roreri MCA 2997]|uniref:DUF6593 domain-containing protein n=2 Tax=Moniliophthora roreri TaxID=221103 RepID=V2XRG9_MONRO|nr:hypothetical protein Moror_12753 [Moniliophthora roreri MCA 2997]
MDLLLSKDSVRNCTITLLSGQPVYEVSTSSRLFQKKTIIKKFRGYEVYDMAVIELHDFHDNVCQVWGRHMLPKSDGLFSSGRSFVASDGQKYTWKTTSGKPTLRDKLDNTIAIYERSRTGFFSGNASQAKISVSQAGLSIVDDIVATFVLVKQKDKANEEGIEAGSEVISAVAGA